MLLSLDRTAVLKKDGRSVLLLKASVPVVRDAEDPLFTRINDFYTQIYDATYSAAKNFAERCPKDTRELFVLTVTFKEETAKNKLTVRRKFILSCGKGIIAEKSFVDAFKLPKM